MAKIYHNGTLLGTVRSNYILEKFAWIDKPLKLIFVPDNRTKGTPFYFPPQTIEAGTSQHFPDFSKIIEQRLNQIHTS